MNANRLSTISVVFPVLLLIGCGSGASTVTKPRTEAECAGLEERAAGWLEGTPTADEAGREERRRNICKDAFAYDKGMTLQIEAIKCILDLRKDTLTSKDKRALVSTIKDIEQSIEETKKFAKQISTCPELGD